MSVKLLIQNISLKYQPLQEHAACLGGIVGRRSLRFSKGTSNLGSYIVCISSLRQLKRSIPQGVNLEVSSGSTNPFFASLWGPLPIYLPASPILASDKAGC